MSWALGHHSPLTKRKPFALATALSTAKAVTSLAKVDSSIMSAATQL
jgi:hypothetical protein